MGKVQRLRVESGSETCDGLIRMFDASETHGRKTKFMNAYSSSSDATQQNDIGELQIVDSDKRMEVGIDDRQDVGKLSSVGESQILREKDDDRI